MMYAFGIWLTASVLFAGIGLTAWNSGYGGIFCGHRPRAAYRYHIDL